MAPIVPSMGLIGSLAPPWRRLPGLECRSRPERLPCVPCRCRHAGPAQSRDGSAALPGVKKIAWRPSNLPERSSLLGFAIYIYIYVWFFWGG